MGRQDEHGPCGLLACRYITEEEVEPVMNILMPGERHYAKEQAEHMITQVSAKGAGVVRHGY